MPPKKQKALTPEDVADIFKALYDSQPKSPKLTHEVVENIATRIVQANRVPSFEDFLEMGDNRQRLRGFLAVNSPLLTLKDYLLFYENAETLKREVRKASGYWLHWITALSLLWLTFVLVDTDPHWHRPHPPGPTHAVVNTVPAPVDRAYLPGQYVPGDVSNDPRISANGIGWGVPAEGAETAKHELKAVASVECWVEVVSEDAAFDSTLQPHTSLGVRDKISATFRSGCPGQVQYFVDGKEISICRAGLPGGHAIDTYGCTPNLAKNPAKVELVKLP